MNSQADETKQQAGRAGRRSISALLIVLLIGALVGTAWVMRGKNSQQDISDAEFRRGSTEAQGDVAQDGTTLVPVEESERRAATREKADGALGTASAESTEDDRVADEALKDAALVVRAVDDSGKPVAAVEIEWVYKTATGEVHDGMIKGETDADGLLVVEDAARILAMAFSESGSDSPFAGMFARVGLRSTMPFEDYAPTESEVAPGVCWIDSRPVPGVPVELILPPFGFVRFEWDSLSDAVGEPVASYWLHVRRSDGGHFPGWRAGLRVTGATEHRFGPIGLGWEVFGSVTPDSISKVVGQVTGPGPLEAGGTVPLRIEFKAEAQDLVRLFGSCAIEGEGLVASKRLRLALGEHGARATPTVTVKTDQDGAWEVQLPRAILVSRATLFDAHDARDLQATVQIPREPLPVRQIDLGEVKLLALAPPPPEPLFLASGRVTDQSGDPIVGANVQASGRARTYNGEAADPKAWTSFGWFETDENGEYELRAVTELAEAELSIRATHREHVRAPSIKVEVGTVGVDFALTRGHSVALEVKVEPWVLMHEAVSLRFEGKDVSRKPSLMDFAGHYRGQFSGLNAGKYRLRAQLHGGKFVIYERELDVTADVDLGEVDLRGKLITCAARLVDERGEPLARGYVQVVDPRTRVTIDRSAKVDKRGIIRMILPRTLDSVVLSHSEAGTATIDASAFAEPDLKSDAKPVTVKFKRQQ